MTYVWHMGIDACRAFLYTFICLFGSMERLNSISREINISWCSDTVDSQTISNYIRSIKLIPKRHTKRMTCIIRSILTGQPSKEATRTYKINP